MSFDVPADDYGRFMGRFAEPLAPLFADAAGIDGGSVLDVGCGPGALTRELLARGADVCAVDPSESFVASARGSFPAVDVQVASAEDLPFEDRRFDAVLAQLVVHFMSDPVAGLSEMARVTRPGGVVAACVWDHAGDRGPLSPFWRAVNEVDPDAEDEGRLPGTARHHLAGLLAQAGLADVAEHDLAVSSEFGTFEEWWQTYTLGVGPPGAYLQRLDDPQRDALQQACRRQLPTTPFTIEAHAWCVVAHTSAD